MISVFGKVSFELKKLICIAVCFALAVCFAGCDSKEKFAAEVFDERVKNAKEADDLDDLIEELNLKIGTAYCRYNIVSDEVGTILYLEYFESIGEADFNETVKPYAAALLALVKNLDEVRWTFEVKGVKSKGSLDVAKATELAGADIKSFFSTEEQITSLLCTLGLADEKGNEIVNNQNHTIKSEK